MHALNQLYKQEIPLVFQLRKPTNLPLLAILLLCGLCYQNLYGQESKTINGWKAFAKVQFEEKLIEKIQQYLFVPQFDAQIKQLEGQRVKLKGFVMPFDYGDEPFVVLSKYPYSSCFFCGGAGPESVA
ncbi:MAG: hypothetical protein AAGI07_07300 [Bacteroidota bacterium]